MTPPVALSTAPSEQDQLDRSLLGGIAWTGSMKWFAQLVSWVSTLVVARLLAPQDYGIIGMASVYLGLVTLFNEFGLGTAIVTKPELTGRQVAQLNSLSVLIGSAAFLLSCVVAMPLAAFYGAPLLRRVVMTMSLAFVITALQTVPTALLQRDFRFKWLAVSEGLQAVAASLSMVILALLGCGYWTLVFGNLTGVAVITLLALIMRPHRFAWPHLNELKDTLTFGSHIMGSRLAWYAQSNADFLVAGRVLGSAALGAYTFAWTLASMPVDKVSALMGRVTPAFFSAVQNDRDALRRYLLNLTEALALIAIPLALGVALVSDELVLLLLGEKWIGVIGPLRVLSVAAALRPLATLLPQVLTVTGDTRVAMNWGLVGVFVLPAGFVLGSAWGTVGIASAWLLVYPLTIIPLYRLVFRRVHVSVGQYMLSVWPALSGSIGLVACVLLLRTALPSGWPLPLRLSLEIVTGGVSYLVIVLTLHRQRIAIFRDFFRRLRS